MLIQLRGLSKHYGSFAALRHVDLDVAAGELLALVGKSGSGKSTLLHLVGGIDAPSGGSVTVGGARVDAMTQDELSKWRGRNVGFVFQFFQLLPTLTAAENVMLAMDFCGVVPPRERRPKALALLDRFGVGRQADKLPATLSGGEQQRVAIARALANGPRIVLADEPTGNLDSHTAGEVLDLFRELASRGTTVVLATHDRDVGRVTDRTIELADGALAAAR